jgi:hypothetical protein
MKTQCLVTLVASIVTGAPAFAQTGPIRHVVVTVAATNDEWTTTGLQVSPDDIVIVSAPGTIKVGQVTGEVDANGARPHSSGSTGIGILEYKVGVGAGKQAGTFSLIRADLKGELKFRVKDTRYDDNAGAFEVDVLVIPESAIPAAKHVGDAAPVDMDSYAAKAEKINLVSLLISMRTAEETFFTDSNRYTDRLKDLPMIHLPSGLSFKLLSATNASWKGIVVSTRLPGVECGVAVATPNPVSSSAGEGEPVCR